MDVVLPDPFTPAIITTVGPVGLKVDAGCRVGEQFAKLRLHERFHFASYFFVAERLPNAIHDE